MGPKIRQSFPEKPETTLSLWTTSVLNDSQRNISITEYNTYQTFQAMTASERKKVTHYIFDHYHVTLRLPSRKIVLANEFDQLGSLDASECLSTEGVKSDTIRELPKEISAKHLLLIVYSLAKQQGVHNREEQIKTPSPPVPYKFNDDGKLIVGKPPHQIKFHFDLDPTSSPDDLEGIFRVYHLINKLNQVIASRPVSEVKEGYGRTAGEPLIKIPTASNLAGAAHETGHQIFEVLLGQEAAGEERNMATDEYWQRIYYLSLGFDSYEIVDDSNYISFACDPIGHPFDNPSELFASAVMVYTLYSEALKSNASDVDTHPKVRRLGDLISYYFSTKIFQGSSVAETTPPPILDSEVQEAVKNAFAHSSYWIRKAAISAAIRLKYNHPDFQALIVRSLYDADEKIVLKALDAIATLQIRGPKVTDAFLYLLDRKKVVSKVLRIIGELQLNNPWLTKHLISFAEEEGPYALFAIRSLGQLGINTETVKKRYHAIFVSRNPSLMDVAIEAVGNSVIADPELEKDLRDILNNTSLSFFRLRAATALLKLGHKDVVPTLKELVAKAHIELQSKEGFEKPFLQSKIDDAQQQLSKTVE